MLPKQEGIFWSIALSSINTNITCAWVRMALIFFFPSPQPSGKQSKFTDEFAKTRYLVQMT